MKQVNPLNKNSTIAIISPSWGGPASFPWVYELGISRLKEKFGFKIKEYPTTRSDAVYNHKHPKERALDIVKAFHDPNVDGIICSIGGDDAIRLLKYLDKYKFPPKFFMGYSDSTVLLTYFYEKGFCTFHGPTIMAGFAEPGKLNDEFCEHIKSFLAGKWQAYTYKPYKQWTEELMTWSNPASLKKIRKYNNNKNWHLLKSPNKNLNINVEGIFWGGCLEALEFIKGTKYWSKSKTFWNDKIVFFEISDEKISHNQLKWILRNYGVQGMYDKAQALLVGRFANVTLEEKQQYEKVIGDVIYDEFKSTMPIIMNMDFGHTYPQQIIPLGAQGQIKVKNNNISISIKTPFIIK